jgi:hypothetical protein
MGARMPRGRARLLRWTTGALLMLVAWLGLISSSSDSVSRLVLGACVAAALAWSLALPSGSGSGFRHNRGAGIAVAVALATGVSIGGESTDLLVLAALVFAGAFVLSLLFRCTRLPGRRGSRMP